VVLLVLVVLPGLIPVLWCLNIPTVIRNSLPMTRNPDMAWSLPEIVTLDPNIFRIRYHLTHNIDTLRVWRYPSRTIGTLDPEIVAARRSPSHLELHYRDSDIDIDPRAGHSRLSQENQGRRYTEKNREPPSHTRLLYIFFTYKTYGILKKSTGGHSCKDDHVGGWPRCH
jgi:hypothetical protein